jgi:hypothetical protein
MEHWRHTEVDGARGAQVLEAVRMVRTHPRQMEQSELIGKGWNLSGVASFLLHVGPSGDGFGGQAFIKYYTIGLLLATIGSKSKINYV